MIKLTWVCDKCKAEVEQLTSKGPNFMTWSVELPEGWVSEEINGELIALCDKCGGALIDKQVELEAAKAKFVSDISAICKEEALPIGE